MKCILLGTWSCFGGGDGIKSDQPGNMEMIEPLCPLFGRCGGCSLQDVDYADQLEKKRAHLSEVLDFRDIPVHSAQSFGYRNRMDFVFHKDGLGLREKGAYDRFVKVEECPIARPEINALLAEVSQAFSDAFYFDVRRRFGAFCYAVIRTTSADSSLSLVLNQKDKKLDYWRERIADYAQTSKARNVLVTLIPPNRNVSISEDYSVIKGADRLREDSLGCSFLFPVQGFFQVNQAVAVKVHEYVLSLLSRYDTENTTLLDLYGGVGTFGIINASLFKEVIILESYEPAVRCAEDNIAANRIANARTLLEDAKRLKTIKLPSSPTVILDPPRSGMHPKTVEHLNTMGAERIIYVSCNAKILAQDLEKLDSYRITSAALFDMFPQTEYFETVVELIRRD
jgi:23S rRNA (uracil-5-)-methyltransferase RumA